MLTGYADESAVARARNEGGLYDCILKPWDKDSLIEKVNTALRERSLLN